MSTDQTDDVANDAAPNLSDRSEDKQILLGNFNQKRDLPVTGQRVETKDQEKGRVSKTHSDDSKGNDNESRILGDICRICHMGGYPTIDENRGSETRHSRTVPPVDSETLSTYSYLGPLISACKCRGTVALVHAECLERWLTESGHTRCELCGYKYATKRVLRHNIFRIIAIWFNTVIVTRQMLSDVLYLVVTTPLALFSCYVCALALRMLLKSGLHDVPWMIVAMLPTCSLTLVAYWGWIITLGRLHGRRWRRYWRSNFVIRLIPDQTIPIQSSSRRDQVSSNHSIDRFDHLRSIEEETTEIREENDRSN